MLKGRVKIDYLHIDGDHSYEGCKRDFYDYLPLMNKKGVISIHDTTMEGPQKVVEEIRMAGYQVIDFRELGWGVAFVYLD